MRLQLPGRFLQGKQSCRQFAELVFPRLQLTQQTFDLGTSSGQTLRQIGFARLAGLQRIRGSHRFAMPLALVRQRLRLQAGDLLFRRSSLLLGGGQRLAQLVRLLLGGSQRCIQSSLQTFYRSPCRIEFVEPTSLMSGVARIQGGNCLGVTITSLCGVGEQRFIGGAAFLQAGLSCSQRLVPLAQLRFSRLQARIGGGQLGRCDFQGFL